MMKRNHSGQSWWPLYGLGLIMIGLLFLAHYIAPSSGWCAFLQIGVMAVGYSLILVWLETHPGMLLEQPPAEADYPKVKSLRPGQGQREFYTGSAPALIYGRSEQSNGNLHLNGNGHFSRTIPSRPEETNK